MERPVSFDVTDYNPSDDDWNTGLVLPPPSDLRSSPSSSPMHQLPEMNIPENETDYVEITLEIYEDRVTLHSVTQVAEGRSRMEQDSEPLLQQRNRRKKNSAVNGFANRPLRPNIDTSVNLIGLKLFISMSDAGWTAVEKRFDKMTAKTEGMLIRSKFGACVGIKSKEFALELFDSLSKRCNITREEISNAEFWRFWVYIKDQSISSRLKLFFDMADKDGDGRLTQEEVREFIRLTALASNQAYTRRKADENAEEIMEVLDPDGLGYITMELLLLLDVETFSETIGVEERQKSTKCWYRVFGDFSSSSCITFFKKIALKKKT